jgi:hypothetical protein
VRYPSVGMFNLLYSIGFRDRKKRGRMIGPFVFDDLLCDDCAFHPGVDGAVVVVCARSGEGERVCIAVSDVGRRKRWKTSVQG